MEVRRNGFLLASLLPVAEEPDITMCSTDVVAIV
jgi:hypothetical protein